jgi:hypothetical protein
VAIADRVRENPFFVLGLEPDAPRAEVERAGQKLLAELALGREAARRYVTPLGPEERTPERVRVAIADLRDPARRLVHEAWARFASGDVPVPERATVPWPVAARPLGLRVPEGEGDGR